jgi:hypothetical protein
VAQVVEYLLSKKNLNFSSFFNPPSAYIYFFCPPLTPYLANCSPGTLRGVILGAEILICSHKGKNTLQLGAGDSHL